MTSEDLENISTDATFIYGKLEFNLEQAVLRNERLEQDDGYDAAINEPRPSTKNEERNGNWTRLYTYSYRDSNGKPKTAHLSQYIIRDPHTGDSAALVFDMDPGRAL